MTTKLEFKGSDVDEAINTACQQLKTKRHQLEVEVVATGSSGIFGLLRRQAVVRVSLKTAKGDETVAALSKPKTAQQTTKTPAPKETEPASTPQKQEAAPSARSRPLPKEAEVEQLAVPDQFHQLLEQELSTLLGLMKMEGAISFSDQDGKTRINISGPCVAQLISHDGQALESLQYLLRKITSSQLPEQAMFILDADGFRGQRRRQLQEMAQEMAAKVKAGKSNRTTQPLSPSERRLVHLALQDDKEIRSRSVGSGLFKKVLIYRPGTGRRRHRSKKKRSS